MRLALLAVIVTTATAFAGTPFGGDDTGFIAPDAPHGPIAKCEIRLAKGVSKLINSILKCHVAEASAKLVGDAAEDGCEGTAHNKFAALSMKGCPGCIDLPSLAATIEGLVNGPSVTGVIYCSSPGGAFGADDSGFVPADSPNGPLTKCENRVAKGAAKMATAFDKCHIARGTLNPIADEDACENPAINGFFLTSLSGCGGCTDVADIAGGVLQGLNADNGLVFCASPSGAFVN